MLITRESSQAEAFSQLIIHHGGIPIEIPMIKITCRKKLEQSFDLSHLQWIFFTSAHGVRCFFANVEKHLFSNVKFATVGHKTEQVLRTFGYEAAFIPSVYDAETMAQEFFSLFPDANDILLVRGNISRRTLIDVLNEKNIRFSTVEVYDTVPNLAAKSQLINVLQKNIPDFLTFTSPSTIDTFVELIENEASLSFVRSLPTVCIGTTTEKRANEKGFTHTLVPDTFTIDSMVEKMLDYIHMEGN